MFGHFKKMFGENQEDKPVIEVTKVPGNAREQKRLKLEKELSDITNSIIMVDLAGTEVKGLHHTHTTIDVARHLEGALLLLQLGGDPVAGDQILEDCSVITGKLIRFVYALKELKAIDTTRLENISESLRRGLYLKKIPHDAQVTFDRKR